MKRRRTLLLVTIAAVSAACAPAPQRDSALQFATCRRVGAKYLVTREGFDMKRAPIPRRTAAEVLPLFKH